MQSVCKSVSARQFQQNRNCVTVGFETSREFQPAKSTQHSADNSGDFGQRAGSETLRLREQRDFEDRPADHLPAPISAATLAPFGLLRRPG